jgi:UDP-N-acetylglucosamine acyltransferase
VVGSDCRIHEYVTVNKGTAGGGMRTVVGDHCLLMAYVHVAHDCIIDDHVVIGNNTQLAGHVKIGARAIVSAMVGVHHFATIGELSFVGAMGGVRYDIPPFTMGVGNPAEPRKINEVGLRRAGFTDESIRELRDAFRALYHDKSRPLSQAVATLKQALPNDRQHPVARLVAWIEEHLESSVRGRVLEATREPVVGMRTPRPELAAEVAANDAG